MSRNLPTNASFISQVDRDGIANRLRVFLSSRLPAILPEPLAKREQSIINKLVSDPSTRLDRNILK